MKKHIVSFSGGKDSTAMLIRMLELGMEVDRIVMSNSKYEFEDLWDYVKKVEKYIQKNYNKNLKIEIVETKDNLKRWLLGEVTRGKHKGIIRGWPLVAYPCYWQREAKYKVLEKEMKGHIRYLGIAYDEAHRRSKHAEELGYRYPLIEWRWTEQDCIDYLKDKGLHNPLYDKFDRLGCWWCPKQSLNSLKILYRDYPDKWRKLREMDKKIKKVKGDSEFKPGQSLDQIEREIKVELKLDKTRKILKENQITLFDKERCR